MGRSKWLTLMIVVLMVGLSIGFKEALTRHPLFFSTVFLLLTFVPLIVRFERRHPEGRELVLLAVLSSAAAVSRIPFASIPNVQPTTFIVIMGGTVFGMESGFIIGATAALVSNLFLGQGPWTPWQMLAWGSIGLIAGALGKSRWFQTRWVLAGFGCLAGYLFGVIMNAWVALSLIHGIDWKAILALYGASFYFDTAHAFTNAILLYLFSPGWQKVLQRFKKKYGLLEARDF
ncbi:ECF transporter S component [Tuberibacillus calidus]|uniref:ECF transporter S component n=1 Tax=Tuberibacillus calidus TaxID=340097 RepID=UPI00041D7CB1|nr:ECF transporter S component [Tuberibacillus calidus]